MGRVGPRIERGSQGLWHAGSNRQRWGECKRCGGSGRRQRLGSRAVHSAVLSVRSERARERERKKRRQ